MTTKVRLKWENDLEGAPDPGLDALNYLAIQSLILKCEALDLRLCTGAAQTFHDHKVGR